MTRPETILYVGASLPAASETFVYREVLGLRERGLDVRVASVHEPDQDLGDPRLDALASEACQVYDARLLPDALAGALRTPDVLARGICDAACGPDLSLDQRPRLLWQCLGGLALARRARGWGVQHVHAHMANTPTAVAMYAAQALRVPYSFTGHAADLFRDRSFLRPKLTRAAFVACISEWHQGFYAREAGLPAERLPLVRCGIDVDAFAPLEGEKAGLLSVGRLVPKKGFHVLLEAIALLPAASRPRLTLVGDGPERGRLEGLVAQHGLQDWVTLTGSRTNDEVRALMPKARGFVLPCLESSDGDRDGIPVALMEAMASGVPVISGDLETIRELIRHEESGLMVPPGDVRALATALERLWSDDDLHAQLVAGGRARVEEEFAQGLNLDRLQGALHRARRRARGGARRLASAAWRRLRAPRAAQA